MAPLGNIPFIGPQEWLVVSCLLCGSSGLGWLDKCNMWSIHSSVMCSILKWHAPLYFQGQQTWNPSRWNSLSFSAQSALGVFNHSVSVKLEVFPHFLSALASNNQFIVKLAKMWPGRTLHVVDGTLKISSDRLKKIYHWYYGAVEKKAEEWLCVE